MLVNFEGYLHLFRTVKILIDKWNTVVPFIRSVGLDFNLKKYYLIVLSRTFLLGKHLMICIASKYVTLIYFWQQIKIVWTNFPNGCGDGFRQTYKNVLNLLQEWFSEKLVCLHKGTFISYTIKDIHITFFCLTAHLTLATLLKAYYFMLQQF